MKLLRIFLSSLTVLVLTLSVTMALAADLVIAPQTLNGPDPIIYDSIEGIVLDNVVIDSGADVTADAAYEVKLTPGTTIKSGGRFTVRVKDNDGLPNRWEAQYFGDLSHDPQADEDGDGLTNVQESQVAGLDPAAFDSDGDGILDGCDDPFIRPCKPTITGGAVAGGTIAVRPVQNSADQFIVEITGTREPGTSVWIDGSEQVSPGDADWSTLITLQPGDNAIEVWLQDPAGNIGLSEWVDLRIHTGSRIVFEYDAAGRVRRIDRLN